MHWKLYFDYPDPVIKHNREVEYQMFKARILEETLPRVSANTTQEINVFSVPVEIISAEDKPEIDLTALRLAFDISPDEFSDIYGEDAMDIINEAARMYLKEHIK